MDNEQIVNRYARRVGYSHKELEMFRTGGHRLRQVEHLFKASPLYTIEAEVLESSHCNSGHVKGQKLILDADGNFITRHCPKRMCVYLVSQLTVPVALINERLSEGLPPDEFHFMRQVQCPDTGVDCMGYGKVRLGVRVVPRSA